MNSIDMLYCEGTFNKFNGIIECVKTNIKTDKVVERLKELKKDTAHIAGHPISDFSVAALDIMNIEKYNGDNVDIKGLIKSKLSF